MQSQSVSSLLKGGVIETKRCLTFRSTERGAQSDIVDKNGLGHCCCIEYLGGLLDTGHVTLPLVTVVEDTEMMHIRTVRSGVE